MDSIEKAAGAGIERLFDYGAAMIVLVLVVVAAGFTIKYLLKRCDERFEQSLKRFEDLAKESNMQALKSTEAFAQNSFVLQEVKNVLSLLTMRRNERE